MKNRLSSGILFVVLGLLIGVGPRTIFSVCPVGNMPMSCHWSAMAEIGAGMLIALTGALLLLIQNAQIRLGLSFTLFLSGVLALLLPTVLIGMCGSVHMDCNKLTLPALVILSALVIVTSAVNIISLLLNEKRRSGTYVR
ncbi:uncharacterized protein DUF4418 [Ruminiclostridium sufflavum DSM 19573]|uniref:Uncharacterized protein DUF4418 n=1 Tax=Ruminiclostridium sufflavum DSM 19573 TaxID=1121337 RepID=A0A318XQP6_9FIRM|nr:DUF4418 family protein [Ruminiclostridium sufflavum]PYG88535.1 uncharacterized protein DUF4418 [Ruminiclostridium sufflavum DSM 19573]